MCQVPPLSNLRRLGHCLIQQVLTTIPELFRIVSAPLQKVIRQTLRSNGQATWAAEVLRFVLLSVGLGLTHANQERSVWTAADPMASNPWLALFMTVVQFRAIQRHGKYDVGTLLHQLSAGVCKNQR